MARHKEPLVGLVGVDDRLAVDGKVEAEEEGGWVGVAVPCPQGSILVRQQPRGDRQKDTGNSLGVKAPHTVLILVCEPRGAVGLGKEHHGHVAAGDPELRRLLGRIRRGEQDRSDLELLNSRCYQPGRQIPWETGVTVVTPLNRNRWNLNLEAALAFQVLQQTAARVFLSEHKWKGGEPTEEEAVLMLGQGDDSATPVPAVFVFVPGMPVVVNQNTHQGLKVVNGAGYTAVAVIPDRAFPGHRVSAELTDFHFVGMPAGTILLKPISVKITAQRKRPWQRNDVSRRGLPCAAAFACTDYKVQGGTIERVALELRGARTATVEGRAVASPCDPYSLYVQLSRCPTLDGITLVSEVRERDFIGNRVPEEMTAAQARLEELSRQTTREAGSLLRG
ncbi:PIF1 protein [Hirsutella rhossiliensis]|uniref:PIF1 protein n=1 Tax=Hirsutella rhossiliensis TaxID=111463 RepID=A0A9P8N3V2_9HYPO|nr:PIF1 protein [Hirsutella rhossiliensis]KAH0965354.1 PIF1 protein [Hirsutella rhossiliensis]